MSESAARAALASLAGVEVVSVSEASFDVAFRDELIMSKSFPGVLLFKSHEAGEFGSRELDMPITFCSLSLFWLLAYRPFLAPT